MNTLRKLLEKNNLSPSYENLCLLAEKGNEIHCIVVVDGNHTVNILTREFYDGMGLTGTYHISNCVVMGSNIVDITYACEVTVRADKIMMVYKLGGVSE